MRAIRIIKDVIEQSYVDGMNDEYWRHGHYNYREDKRLIGRMNRIIRRKK